MNKFDLNHVRVITRVFAYLAGHLNYGIKYQNSKDGNLVGCLDSDFATDIGLSLDMYFIW